MSEIINEREAVLSLRLRPRFEIEVALGRDEAYQRMRRRLEEGSPPWHVALLNDQIEVSPRQRNLHFWSPYLKVALHEEGENRTKLRGRFGPNVNLWTLLVAIYAICGLVGTTGLLIAFSQWQLGLEMSGWLLTLGCTVVAFLVWGGAQLGQRFAQQQMEGIYAFLQETYADVIEQATS